MMDAEKNNTGPPDLTCPEQTFNKGFGKCSDSDLVIIRVRITEVSPPL